jgi:hypothetical protein
MVQKQIRVYIFVLLILAFIGFSLLFGTSGLKESFENLAWAQPTTYNQKMEQHAAYEGLPVPLPEGKLFLFAENKTSPNCCGTSVYTSSDGCLCVTKDQIDYLNRRGGNRNSGGDF